MPGDASALAAALRSGRTDAGAVMRAALAAVRDHARLGAICALDAGLGQAQAAGFDALPAGDPARAAAFAGLPLLVKDLGGPFAGLPVRAGSRALPATLGDSALAAAFRSAGLLPFGLTTSPEFGLSLASEPAAGPICRNPLNPALGAGGSSGGAAAAVAAGIVVLAHATDAGGSIRVPAAACGLVGLKPGRGVMPQGPGFGNHLAGIASEFAICRSVRDAAALLGAMAPQPPAAPRPLRIALLGDTGPDWPVTPARSAAVVAAAEALASAGHHVSTLPWSAVETAARRSAEIFAGIICANLAALAQHPDFTAAHAEPLTRAVIERGRAMPASGLWQLIAALPEVAQTMTHIFDSADLILLPMLAGPALPIGAMPMDHGDTALHFHRMAAYAPLATLANIAGLPALTLPFGSDDQGLPLPVQLLAPPGGEARLLAIAATLECAQDWRHPHPLAGLPA